jgi:hypothetical protein
MVCAVVAEGSVLFVHWGVVQISVANLLVIGLMLVVFVIAVLTPLGRESTSVPEPGTEP